jgi:hypothetical protein
MDTGGACRPLRPGRRGNGVSWVAVLVALLPLTVGSFASAAERKADLVIDDLASFAPASAVSRLFAILDYVDESG